KAQDAIIRRVLPAEFSIEQIKRHREFGVSSVPGREHGFERCARVIHTPCRFCFDGIVEIELAKHSASWKWQSCKSGTSESLVIVQRRHPLLAVNFSLVQIEPQHNLIPYKIVTISKAIVPGLRRNFLPALLQECSRVLLVFALDHRVKKCAV